MAIKSGIIFITLVLGCLAIPKPELDVSQFYQHVDPEARIVGGTAAAEGAHPHMVAMTTGNLIRSFICGGSVVTQRTVLTAAHCIAAVFSWGSLSRSRLFLSRNGGEVKGLMNKAFEVIFASTRKYPARVICHNADCMSSLRVTVGTNRWNQGGQSYSLSGNVTHQHYVSSTIKNDIGILITSSNIVYNDRVRPIPISFEYAGAGIASKAAGWGRIANQAALSAQLLELDVQTISGQQCVTDVAEASVNLNVRAPPIEPHIEICIVHSNGAGFGMCNGDSGSALVRVDQGTQIGVVSWGFPCARGAPDMFARVSAYEDWFTQHVRN